MDDGIIEKIIDWCVVIIMIALTLLAVIVVSIVVGVSVYREVKDSFKSSNIEQVEVVKQEDRQ